jgi:hypothetical protein
MSISKRPAIISLENDDLQPSVAWQRFYQRKWQNETGIRNAVEMVIDDILVLMISPFDQIQACCIRVCRY